MCLITVLPSLRPGPEPRPSDRLNPAVLARRIAHLQTGLLVLAKDKTEQLYLASIPSALPDVRKGIRIKAS